MLVFHRSTNLSILTLAVLFASGCADNMHSTLAPQYQGQRIPVSGIGVAGPGASLATQGFIAQGYNVHELGTAETGSIQEARKQNLPFVAVVDAVDSSQAVWNGLFSFAMRVSTAESGAVVWSASGTFGQGGLAINLQVASRNAMKAMIADFAKTFPAAKAAAQ